MDASRRLDAGAAALFGSLLLLLVTAEWVSLTTQREAVMFGDLAIYREAIQYAASGGHLYDYVYLDPALQGLGFTYPPFAVLALAPLTWFPLDVTESAWMAVTFSLAVLLVWIVVSRAARQQTTWLGSTPNRGRVMAATFAGATLLLVTFPFLHNVGVGQITLVIIALGVVDLSGLVPSRWQGVLTGLAAAVKLTPLIFLPYFLITRQWRQALLCGGTLLVATGLAAVTMPTESAAYWGSKVLQTSRVGQLDSPINKSILGTLSRWEFGGEGVTIWWLVLCVMVAAVTMLGARRLFRAGDSMAAALLVGCLGTLLSPITWPHHQMWAVLAGIWLVLQRRPLGVLMGSATLGVFAVHGFFLEPAGPGLAARIGWDLPTVAVLAICLLGLPTAEDRAQGGAELSRGVSWRSGIG